MVSSRAPLPVLATCLLFAIPAGCGEVTDPPGQDAHGDAFADTAGDTAEPPSDTAEPPGDTAAPDTGPADTSTPADTNVVEPQGPIAVAGVWASPWGEEFDIDDARWGDASVARFDNDARWAILQNPPDDDWNPDKFMRNVWTEPVDGSFYTCTVVFGGDTEAEVEHPTGVWDASDPDVGGCGDLDFPWTRLSPALAIRGLWATNFGFEEAVSSSLWGSADVRAYDNEARWAVVQNPDDDPWNPAKFARHVWTPQDAGGAFHTCTSAHGLDTLDEALATAGVYDDTAPDVGGCGELDFPWTWMAPAIAIAGIWRDAYDVEIAITSFSWGDDEVVAYGNPTEEPGWAVVATGSGFDRLAFVGPSAAGIDVCVVAADLASAEEGSAASAALDWTDPATGGCHDGPWRRLVAP